MTNQKAATEVISNQGASKMNTKLEIKVRHFVNLMRTLVQDGRHLHYKECKELDAVTREYRPVSISTCPACGALTREHSGTIPHEETCPIARMEAQLEEICHEFGVELFSNASVNPGDVK
jgi:hypothetical protein